MSGSSLRLKRSGENGLLSLSILGGVVNFGSFFWIAGRKRDSLANSKRRASLPACLASIKWFASETEHAGSDAYPGIFRGAFMTRCDAMIRMKIAARGWGKLAVCFDSFDAAFR